MLVDKKANSILIETYSPFFWRVAFQEQIAISWDPSWDIKVIKPDYSNSHKANKNEVEARDHFGL